MTVHCICVFKTTMLKDRKPKNSFNCLSLSHTVTLTCTFVYSIATPTITMSSFIFIILFHTLSTSMATAQLLNAATQDASNGGLVLIINLIFVVEILCFYLFAYEVAIVSRYFVLNIAVAYVTDENFGSLVLNSETLVLVEFFAPLCGPCKNVDFKMVELANEYAGEVEFFKLNVDENQLIPSKYRIKGIPNVLIFKNGEQRDTLFGNLPKATFIRRMEQNL